MTRQDALQKRGVSADHPLATGAHRQSPRPAAIENNRQARTVSHGIHINFSPHISNTMTVTAGGHGYTMHSRSIYSDPSTGQYFENVTVTGSGARTGHVQWVPFADGSGSGSESETERPQARETSGQVPSPFMRKPRMSAEPVYTPGYLARQTGAMQGEFAAATDYRPSAPPLTLPRNS